MLWALHVLLEEVSVTRAARRLHVSQSAVSNQLARLRTLLSDPLLVRDGRRLTRTPRADALRAPLTAAVEHIGQVLLEERPFDPAQEARRYVLACDDAVEVCDVPLLLAAMQRELPRASLRVVSIDRLIAHDGLARGEVDVALGPRVAFAQACFTPLYVQGALLALHRDHPFAGKRLSRTQFNQLRHVDTWIANGEPGEGHRRVSAQLAAHGFVRNVALVVSHFGAAASAAAATDLAAGLPERVALYYAEHLPLALSPFPPPLTFQMELGLGWHERTSHDPSSQYFRALIQRTLGTSQRASKPPKTAPRVATTGKTRRV